MPPGRIIAHHSFPPLSPPSRQIDHQPAPTNPHYPIVPIVLPSASSSTFSVAQSQSSPAPSRFLGQCYHESIHIRSRQLLRELLALAIASYSFDRAREREKKEKSNVCLPVFHMNADERR